MNAFTDMTRHGRMRLVRGWLIAGVLLVAPVLAHAQAPMVQAQLSATTCPAAAGAANGCVALSVQGLRYAGVQITGSGTWTATFEVSNDGVNYQTVSMTPSNSATTVTTATAAGMWNVLVAGFQQIRVRLSAYTSGTPVVTILGAV